MQKSKKARRRAGNDDLSCTTIERKQFQIGFVSVLLILGLFFQIGHQDIQTVFNEWSFGFPPSVYGFTVPVNGSSCHESATQVNESRWQKCEKRLNNGTDLDEVDFDSKKPELSAIPEELQQTIHNIDDSPISEESYNGNLLPIKETPEIDNSGIPEKLETSMPKNERLSRAIPLGLDEFKSRASSPKAKPIKGQTGTIIHRLETGGLEYNYAAASKGAKILAYNKDAKGASNILGKDKDKYLRNPCSTEEKFVVIEVSEETLVDTIEIANFEHYSSNFKDFELLGSLVYPTDNWVNLGTFKAGNVKHVQRFTLQDPKWVRYLKLNLLSHYGNEFYCTLSSVEVYGVDAVERMLEDLISIQDSTSGSEEATSMEHISLVSSTEPIVREEIYENESTDIDAEFGLENSHENAKTNLVPTSVSEARPQQGGRMPGDAVLKILMQKVRSLDLSLSVLERYLEELNARYGTIFKELDEEIAAKDEHLLKMKNDMKLFDESKEAIAKDVASINEWKSLISLQMDSLAKDNAILRLEVETVRMNQVHMENKGALIFAFSILLGLISILKLFIDKVTMTLCIQKSESLSWMRSPWLLLLLSCSLVVIVLL